ncbi:MAG: SDR family oxidoreductase [Solirubrobacterales bacterium]|nr:SDR family oxidoreductase [Solirubrobacterales bacterium]
MTTPLLKDKHAVIYGGAGRIGRGVARTFAAEGAHVHLAGRTERPLAELAAEIGADFAVLDAADARAVDEHLDGLERVDVSFNLCSRGDVHGTPLAEMPVDRLMAPLLGLRSTFVTAGAAARRMIEQRSGVILWLNSASGPGAGPGMGGTGPADAAMDNYMKQLARDNGSRGLRVCGIWTAGVDMDNVMAGYSAMGRAPRLDEVADAAAFLASEKAGGTSGSVLNVTAGVVF